jgi:hypothetical protein
MRQTPSPTHSLPKLLLISLMLFASSMAAGQGFFDQGAKRVTVIAGVGRSFDDDYLILGVGFGYYLIDGLELGINWQSWLGGDPSINQLTPELSYVFRNQSKVQPYIGALYRRTFISGFDDLSALGARAGIYVSAGRSAYVGIGAVFLSYQDCSEEQYSSCSDSYPEFSFAFSF